jgi:hypothetical protein
VYYLKPLFLAVINRESVSVCICKDEQENLLNEADKEDVCIDMEDIFKYKVK